MTTFKTTDKTGAPTTVSRRGTEFTITVGGQTVGAAAFEDRGNRRVFVHTEVDNAFQGRGLATILIDEAIKSTKAAGKRVAGAAKARGGARKTTARKSAGS